MGAILMEVTEVMSWSEPETQSFPKPDQVFFLPKDEGPVSLYGRVLVTVINVLGYNVLSYTFSFVSENVGRNKLIIKK